MRRALVVGLGLFASLVIPVSVGVSATHADTPDCTVSPMLVNSCRPWLGAVVANYPQVPDDTQSQVLYHEQRIGRQLDIVHTYHPAGDNTLSAADVYFANRPNTMLFANWKPTDNWADIASQNAGIDQMAASIKSLGDTRIFLTLFHEPENNVSPGGDPNCPNVAYKGSAGSVSDYRAMWSYVENRFAADGVQNVVWDLDYMNYQAWDCLIPDLYPGNNLVDWITFNAYDNGPTATFGSVVKRFTNLLASDTDAAHAYTSKPWGIAEWGAKGRTPAQAMAYYDSAKAAVDANVFPNIKAYMIYDSNDQGAASGASFRVGYDDDSTYDPVKGEHYAAFADDPALGGDFSQPPPVDTTAPTVTLSSPTAWSLENGVVTVDGSATDDHSVSVAALLVNGAYSGQIIWQPGESFSLDWDSSGIANGLATLQLEAVDEAGNVGMSNVVPIGVANGYAPPPAPPALTRSLSE